MNMSHGFETVIIDEAAQAVELSSLIPLKVHVSHTHVEQIEKCAY